MGAGVGTGVGDTTLGGIACILGVGVGTGYRDSSLAFFTLGVSVSSFDLKGDGTGNLSDRFKIVAISKSEFLVGSPASRLGVVVVSVEVRILIISSAACLKKSSVFTFGNEITFGKKVTVSISLTNLILGKYTLIHL